MELFERASNRFISDEERQRLTTFVIVGGGPTSIEFSGELHDFIVEDVAKWFPDIKTRVIVVESTDHILGSFDAKLTDYAMNILKSRSEITLKTNTHVKSVHRNEVVLSDGETIPCGITVWSTGTRRTIRNSNEIDRDILRPFTDGFNIDCSIFERKTFGKNLHQ